MTTLARARAARDARRRAVLRDFRGRDGRVPHTYDSAPWEAGSYRHRNTERAELYYLGDFYSWLARRGTETPVGGDPRDGLPWSTAGPRAYQGRTIARAMNTAAARACYELARRIPNPLP